MLAWFDSDQMYKLHSKGTKTITARHHAGLNLLHIYYLISTSLFIVCKIYTEDCTVWSKDTKSPTPIQ